MNHEEFVTALTKMGMTLHGARSCIAKAVERGLTVDRINELIDLYRNIEKDKPTVAWLHRWLSGASEPPVPASSTHLVAGIDVTAEGLWWMVVEVNGQHRTVIAASSKCQPMTVEALCSSLEKSFRPKISLILIDASWFPSRHEVKACCINNPIAKAFYGIRASIATRNATDLWYMRDGHVRAFSDRIKSKVFDSLLNNQWSTRGLTRELAEHLFGERATDLLIGDSHQIRWEPIEGRKSNLLDCAVMCETAALMIESPRTNVKGTCAAGLDLSAKAACEDDPPSLKLIKEFLRRLKVLGIDVTRVYAMFFGAEFELGWFAALTRQSPITIELCFIGKLDDYMDISAADSHTRTVSAMQRTIESLGRIGDWEIEGIFNDPAFKPHVALEASLFVSRLTVQFRKAEQPKPIPPPPPLSHDPY